MLVASTTAVNGNCVEFEIWKGGDDGLTNRVFDQLNLYNQGLADCNSGQECQKRYLLIATNVSHIPENGEEAVSVPIEVYRDIRDRTTLENSFVVYCDVGRGDCAASIFGRLM